MRYSNESINDDNSKGLVFLVSAPFASHLKPGGMQAAMGITLIGACLKKEGYEVKIFMGTMYPNYEETLLNAVTSENPLFIGFTAMTPQVMETYRLTKAVKKIKPEIPVVWGGFHCMIYPEVVAEDEHVDFVAYGEGVVTAVKLADALRTKSDFSEVPGICFKKDGGIIKTEKAPLADFEDIPDVDWDIFDRDVLEKTMTQMTAVGETIRGLQILTGLGCRFKCTFCHNEVFQSKHRIMSAERIVANIKRLKEKYNVDYIRLEDEHFLGSKERFFRFLELMEKENISVQIHSNIRASDVNENYITEEVLKRYKKVGGHMVTMGGESGSMRILKMLRKGITVDQVRNAVRTIRNAGLLVSISFIIGLPDETSEEIMSTYDLINEIREIHPEAVIIGPLIFDPYPGSALYKKIKEMGWKEPGSLAEWAANEDLASPYFKSINKSNTPWVKNPGELRKIILAQLGLILTSTLGYHLKNGRIFSRVIPLSFLIPLVALEKWRIRHRNYKLMFELPLLAFFFKLRRMGHFNK